ELEARLTPDASSFVTGLYSDLLHRTPDAPGLAAWVSALNHGASRQQVVQAIYNSAEHRGIQVADDYANILGRAVDPTGKAAWVSALVNGQISEQGLQFRLLTSAEYLNSHNTPAAYITGVYLDVLGRIPTTNEEAAWENVLFNFGAGAVT